MTDEPSRASERSAMLRFCGKSDEIVEIMRDSGWKYYIPSLVLRGRVPRGINVCVSEAVGHSEQMKEAEHFLRANEMAISRICSLISDVECAELDFPIEVNEA